MAELCLGTVQFGMKYGVNNTLGQPSWKESFHMLDIAIERGIKIIDTARAYGEAEEILGKYILDNNIENKIKIISKLCPNVIDKNEKDVIGVVRKELEESLSRLHVSQLDGYLLHTPDYIYNKQILAALVQIKNEKLVNHIGISIYDIEQGEEAIRTGILDYIQLPYSILDQRGIQTELIKKAKQHGITIFSRSAFLQGLYMMEKDKIPFHLKAAIPYLVIFDRLLEKYNLKKTQALLKFVTQEQGIDYLVFGVDNPKQLLEDINIYQNGDIPKQFIDEVKQEFYDIDKSIIFPSLWSDGKKVNKRK